MVDTSRAKKLGSMISMAGNVPTPASPILKAVGYGFKALAFIGDIRNAREGATQKKYQEYIQEYLAQRQKQLIEIAKKNKKRIFVGAGLGLAGLGLFFVMRYRRSR